jgi:hypothetical protein
MNKPTEQCEQPPLRQVFVLRLWRNTAAEPWHGQLIRVDARTEPPASYAFNDSIDLLAYLAAWCAAPERKPDP